MTLDIILQEHRYYYYKYKNWQRLYNYTIIYIYSVYNLSSRDYKTIYNNFFFSYRDNTTHIKPKYTSRRFQSLLFDKLINITTKTNIFLALL